MGGVGEDAGYACALCVLLEIAIEVSVLRRTVLGPAPMRIAKPEGGIVRCRGSKVLGGVWNCFQG